MASEKQKGVYNLTAKEAGGSCLFFRISEVSCPRFLNCFSRLCEWRSQRTGKPLSESHLGLKVSLATQGDITRRAQLTEPVLALPQTSSCAGGRCPRPSLPPFPPQGSRAPHSQLTSYSPASQIYCGSFYYFLRRTHFKFYVPYDAGYRFGESTVDPGCFDPDKRYFPVDAHFYHCLTPCENLSISHLQFHSKAKNILRFIFGFNATYYYLFFTTG